MPDTILEIFEATARAHADRPAMASKRGGRLGEDHLARVP